MADDYDKFDNVDDMVTKWAFADMIALVQELDEMLFETTGAGGLRELLDQYASHPDYTHFRGLLDDMLGPEDGGEDDEDPDDDSGDGDVLAFVDQ